MKIMKLLAIILGVTVSAATFAANGNYIVIKRWLDLPNPPDDYKFISQISQNRDAVTGHWIRLKAVVQDNDTGADISPGDGNYFWVILGAVVKTYIAIPSKGEKTDLQAADKVKQKINYYYTSGSGDQPLGVEVLVGGVPIWATDYISLHRPTVAQFDLETTDLHPNTQGVGVDTTLHFGKVGGTHNGVEFTGIATAPTVNCPAELDGRGKLAAFQRIKWSNSIQMNDGGGNTHWEDSGSATKILDRSTGAVLPSYNEAETAVAAGAQGTHNEPKDSPNITLLGSLQASADQEFDDWFMYKPGGTNSIYVTIHKVDKWFWKGKSSGSPQTLTANSWGATLGPIVGGDETELPEWTGYSGDADHGWKMRQ